MIFCCLKHLNCIDLVERCDLCLYLRENMLPTMFFEIQCQIQMVNNVPLLFFLPERSPF